MIVPQDAIFRDERERYRLRFTCEDCALFDDRDRSCAHGYPTADHRTVRYLDPEAPIIFCKDFDLV
jgi:hypothetical protein